MYCNLEVRLLVYQLIANGIVCEREEFVKKKSENTQKIKKERKKDEK